MTSSRLKQLILTVMFGTMLLSIGLLRAQDATARALTPGISASGSLSATNLAQVYTVSVSTGRAISVTVTTKSGSRLALLATDAAGTSLGQSVASAADANVVLEISRYQQVAPIT